jgi:NAD(P)-dependent dehydrogenase (short-subunit alcohol dehydrogenase family)
MVYSTAKAAVIHLTRLVAMELGESNVRVNCISPGGIATGIFGKAAGLPTDQAEKTAELMEQVPADIQPIRRAGIVGDIAQAAVFLASDESTFINGHTLVVDGGLTGGRLWSVQQEGLDAMRQALRDASKS